MLVAADGAAIRGDDGKIASQSVLSVEEGAASGAIGEGDARVANGSAIKGCETLSVWSLT